MKYKILLPRNLNTKPVQLFANNSTIAMNEARELSCRNKGVSVQIYLLTETLLDTISCASLDEGKANKDVVPNQTKKENS